MSTSNLPPPLLTLIKQKKLTDPLDIKFKHDYELITSLFKSVKSGFSFKRIHTLEDVLLGIGHSKGEVEYAFSIEQLNASVVFKQIEELESGYINHLVLAYENNKSNKTFEAVDHIYAEVNYTVTIGGGTVEEVTVEKDGDNDKVGAEILEGAKKDEEAKTKKETVDPYTIPLTSPHQKAKLMIHQTRAAHALIDKIVIEKKRCVLLEAPVGSGKTFIFGALLRYLDDHNFIEENRCISPWPFCIVTKASVVEQTKRVMRDQFGMDMNYKCHVINVEQLRAKFGEYLLDEKTVMKHGEEETSWVWKPQTHPLVFILDESQLAKNEGSVQSKIIQALSELPEERRIHIICSSATPFTRICEAKYLCVNTHKEI